ncbi:MAG: transposase [Paracoccaceae bacterium]|jgi:transposase
MEDLLIAVSEAEDAPLDENEAVAPSSATSEAVENKPRRRPPVSDTTPRERRELDPGVACPDCGGDLRATPKAYDPMRTFGATGEDVSELLDMITAQLKVIEITRIKKSCHRCEKMVQGPAPSRPIPCRMAGPIYWRMCPLSAMQVSPAGQWVSKFDDHLPLYRQNEIFARMGADIPDSTLVGWVKTGPAGIKLSVGQFEGMNAQSAGRSMQVLQAIIERIETNILASDLLHTDGTPIRVLDRARRGKGLGKGVKQGRIWAYVRDQRPWAGTAPPGAVYYFAPDRKGEHVRQHLKNRSGILQADAYAGFKALYEKGPDGKRHFREAACWAHLRRDFHDVWASDKSQIAREALDRIG